MRGGCEWVVGHDHDISTHNVQHIQIQPVGLTITMSDALAQDYMQSQHKENAEAMDN